MPENKQEYEQNINGDVKLTRKQLRSSKPLPQLSSWTPTHIVGVTLLSLLIIILLAVCNIALDSYAASKNAHAKDNDAVMRSTINNDDNINANEHSDQTKSDGLVGDEYAKSDGDELTDCTESYTLDNSDAPDICKDDIRTNNNKSIKSTLGSIDDNLRKTGDRLEGSINAAQKCAPQEWQNAYDVHFQGCLQPNSGDTSNYEWKLWEDALRDGDICIKTDANGDKIAVMREEC